MSAYEHPVIKIGQVWASNHRCDRTEPTRRQHREVIDIDSRYAYLVTVEHGRRLPVQAVQHTSRSIKGHRLIAVDEQTGAAA
ncbi:MAG TPA: hypothetical protein VN213_22105 [Solirubrobacteraceae bacterium]|nr:hypothetical protein [Solirubrobacteraceae bacterium]